MIAYTFTLDDVLTIQEPQGWAGLVLSMRRDEEMHGVTLEATTNNLGFYGPAADYLEDKKTTFGLSAKVIFKATQVCNPGDEPAVVIEGRLNFGRYRKTCGQQCLVFMPIEQQGCAVTLRNRFDQRVDIDSPVAFDKNTPLEPYIGLGIDVTLTARDIEVGTVGDVGTGAVTHIEDAQTNGGIMVRPVFVKRNESLKDSQLEPYYEYGTFNQFGVPLSPVLLLNDNPDCFIGAFNVDIRLKGTYNVVLPTPAGKAEVVIFEVDDPTLAAGGSGDSPNYREIAKQVLPAGSATLAGAFDLSYTNVNEPIGQGLGIYVALRFIFLTAGLSPADVDVTWAPETHFSITANKSCPPTAAQVYLVNELMARVVESATNNCMTFKSDYFGRVDSQPYASTSDGCGALRALTSGLKVRRAPVAGFFLSPQEAFNGLRAIDNLGAGVEPNPNLPGYDWWRVEPVAYFYQDVEVLRLAGVPNATLEVDESKHYSVIKVGYTKWETQETYGLDEFNSNREYRTSLETVRNTLDIQSNFVAGGYPIEVTRQQSFVDVAEADTKYDNETFIICLQRGAYGYAPEKDNITAPDNFYGPQTAYNFRITPLRNLMRWFKSIINSYTNLSDSTSKLFFGSGTGNYIAAGQITGPCALENGVKPENKDLSYLDFLNQQDYLPLIRPEIITVQRYPLSLKEYQTLKQNPYGYVSVQCGSGDTWVKGYVLELDYEIAKGQASFKLRAKWE